MKITINDLSQHLIEFSESFVKKYQSKNGHLPIADVDEQWDSPCIQGKHSELMDLWRPVIIDDKLSFSNVEQALELTLHEDICHYFSTIYSDSINASCEHGQLTLLFPWCKQDFDRLQENIIGHVLMKRKLKQPITIFFALTDDDDLILSLNNETGEIWVERIGFEPHKKIADSMKNFFACLEA
jgi:SecY interacting protein Syd